MKTIKWLGIVGTVAVAAFVIGARPLQRSLKVGPGVMERSAA